MMEYRGTGYAVMIDDHIINNVIFLKLDDAQKLRMTYIKDHPEYKDGYYIKEFSITEKQIGVKP